MLKIRRIGVWPLSERLSFRSRALYNSLRLRSLMRAPFAPLLSVEPLSLLSFQSSPFRSSIILWAYFFMEKPEFVSKGTKNPKTQTKAIPYQEDQRRREEDLSLSFLPSLRQNLKSVRKPIVGSIDQKAVLPEAVAALVH